MRSEYRWFALTLLLPLVFSACTKRQVGSAAATDTYQYVAQGLCLTFVMDKVRKSMEPGSVFKDTVILSKESDARFRTRYFETSKVITDAKSLQEKERLEKTQMNQLLETLRKESPDLIRKCDRLAEGFRRCDKFQSDQHLLRSCLEQENKAPMEEIIAFLNRDAITGFGGAR
jgi:hypothetical protein